MIIYLQGEIQRPLVRSRIFETEGLWKEKQRRRDIEDSERDWRIYTWNSMGKLSAEEDGTSMHHDNTIEARLERYESFCEEFVANGLPNPEHYIFISSYHEFIYTPQQTMLKIIKKLEQENIFCLLNKNTAPIIPHAEYISPELDNQLQNPLEVIL